MKLIKVIPLVFFGFGITMFGAWHVFVSPTSALWWGLIVVGLLVFSFSFKALSDAEIEHVSIRFKKLHPASTLPSYKTGGASCADIGAVEGGIINAGETLSVATGLAVEIPDGYEMQIRSRSGLSSKGIVVANSPGTVDSDYRGEIKVLLHNQGVAPFFFAAGDRIAQIKIESAEQFTFTEVEEISVTERGSGGFGSTGTGS